MEKVGRMEMTPDRMDGLWGDEGPYSQVQVVREVRILDDRVSRTFFYVKANVNPTTYDTLKAMEARIEDGEIRGFLSEATFVSDEDGYEWTVYGQKALSPRGANRAADQATQAIIRMHQLVMKALELAPQRQGDAPETPPGEGADPAPDADADR